MKTHRRLVTVPLVVFLVALFSAAGPSFAQKKTDVPETVHVTYHVKAGSEAVFQQAIARQWALGRKMNLFNATPHVVVRSVEEGDKPYFIEILEWRDEDIPDHSPAELQAIWNEMRGLVESRQGRPGIDFVQVALVQK
jgi:hypothetical protein